MSLPPNSKPHTPPSFTPAYPGAGSALSKSTKVPSVFAGKAWQQVLARDHSADGRFVYAVKSTHIFCRPSCPSRRPSRKNVSFFPTPEAAESAGYRACKRCEPTLASPRPDPQAQAVAAVSRFLTEHATERIKLADVAKATGIPRLAILRGFKRVLGISPGQFAKAQRLATFKESLKPSAKAPAARVTDAIYDAGFGSSSRLYEGSAATLGMTPTALKTGAPALAIRYALVDSPLGRTLVASTPTGICAIAFAASDAVLRHDLRERFPKASLLEEQLPSRRTEADPQGEWLADAAQFVLAHLSEHPSAATFPFDIRATAFQHRVWQALQQIPRGVTVSYSDLAAKLGQPTAARAVATACAANPVALAVPCHRVIGSKGALTGYRWGIERKEKILAAERHPESKPINFP